jgi:DNA-binding response OmpR family regulator
MLDARPVNLLLVDDDAALLEALTFFLVDEGFDVTGAASGDALRRVMDGTDPLPDAIILDMLLSGENGRNLCEEVKQNARTAALPVILMSAHPLAERHATQSGADGFVAKPFEVDDLLLTIERCTSGSHRSDLPEPDAIPSAAD